MSDEKFYYQIINNQTNEIDFVVCADAEANPEKLCDFLCLNGYHAVQTTKEEYDKYESEEG